MCLAQDDDVVHTLAPDRSDQPFGKPILPRRGRCCRLVPDAHGAQSVRDDGSIDAIPIANEVARRFIPGECLGYLTRNPFRRRMSCYIDPDQVSSVQSEDDEDIEQIETNGRDNEQVPRGDVWRVVTQEGAPSLAWRPPSLDHVFGDARLHDLKPELEQFAVDARCPQSGFSMLIRLISARRSFSICGRPAAANDFSRGLASPGAASICGYAHKQVI